MRIALFCHSLVSDWNHGNAHFLRGICTELLRLGHELRVYEPCDGWSRTNLMAEHGRRPLAEFRRAYPMLRSRLYDVNSFDVARALRHVDLAIAPWSDPQRLFEPGRDLLIARDGAAMPRCLQQVLSHPEQARDMASRAMGTIRRAHTCRHHVRQLLTLTRQLGLNTSRTTARSQT